MKMSHLSRKDAYDGRRTGIRRWRLSSSQSGWGAIACTLALLCVYCTPVGAAQNLADRDWDEEWGIWWSLYLISNFALFGFIFILTLCMLVHQNTYKTVAFKTLVLYLNLLACFGRLVYFIDPEDFLEIYRERTILFLLRMPQVLWLTETLLFIALWKRVYDAYAKAERISSRVTIGRYKYPITILSVILLGGGTITCTLQAADVEVDLMQNIIVALFATYVLGFLVGGGVYAIRLYYVMRKKTVRTDTFSSARAKLSRTVTVWLVVGTVWAVAFGWKSATGELSAAEYLIYYWLLRCCEGVMAIGGLSAIAPSNWRFLLPPYIFYPLCSCKRPPPAAEQSSSERIPSSRRGTSRRRPSRSPRRGRKNRTMSLSSDLRVSNADMSAELVTSGSGSDRSLNRSGSGTTNGSSRLRPDGTRNTVNPLIPATQQGAKPSAADSAV